MRRNQKIRRSILIHIAYIGVAFSTILCSREIVIVTLKHYKISAISESFLNTASSLLMIIIAINQAFSLINRLAHSHINKGNDATSARMVSRILKSCILLAVLLLFGEHIGIGLSGLLAFGGLGGIAIGVAGKDILGNIFSGVMLYFDRPFSIGDWISSPDRKIEGIVSEIGWRLTKITTFDNRPIYIPNSVFSLIIVENPSRMTNRQISTSISLGYQDSDKIKKIVDDIRNMLKENRNIDQKQDLLIYFNSFNTSTLDIMIYCFTKTTIWADWLAAQQDIYLKIIDIVHSNNAVLAVPSQKIQTEPPPAPMQNPNIA